jgi:hypothetical protein
VLTQGGKLRSESETAPVRVVEERFLAKSIAALEELVLDPIKNRERPHSIEPVQHGGAPLAITMQQHFRIRVIGLKLVSCFLQLFPEFDMVVDFTVESDHQCIIRCPHRLGAPSKINNRETPMPEESLVSDPESFTVRTPMTYPSGHSHQVIAVPFSYESGDPAHDLSP